MRKGIVALTLLCISAAYALTLNPGDSVTIAGCTTSLRLSGNVVSCATRSRTPTRTPTSTSVPTATSTVTPTATLTYLPTITRTATVTASPTSTPLPSATPAGALVGLAIIGDSAQDEYQAQTPGDARTTARNWVELLHDLRGVDLGPWGSYPEPRRTGYLRNWARSGGTSVSVRYDQAPGAALQAGPGMVYLVQAGANDLYTGGTPSAAVNNLTAAWAQLDQAAPGRVLVASVQNYIALDLLPSDAGLTPDQAAAYSAALDALNAGLQSQTGASYWDYNAAMAATLSARRSGDFLIVGGQPISIRDRCNALACVWLSDPYMHAGTVMSGLIVNAYIAELNARFGAGLAPLTDAEILGAAH